MHTSRRRGAILRDPIARRATLMDSREQNRVPLLPQKQSHLQAFCAVSAAHRVVR